MIISSSSDSPSWLDYCCWLSLATASAAIGATGVMATEPQRIALPAPGLAEVVIDVVGDAYDVSFDVQQAGKSDWRIYETASNTIWVTHVGAEETVKVRSQVITWESREVQVQDYVITVGNAPPVTVRPIGDAGDFYDVIMAISRPGDAHALRDAFSKAIEVIAADAKITTEAASDELTRWIDWAKVDQMAWTPFFAAVDDYLQGEAKSRATSLAALRVIEKALDAVPRE